jgi:hypothetical protein
MLLGPFTPRLKSLHFHTDGYLGKIAKAVKPCLP